LLSSRFPQRTSRIAWYCRCRRFPFLAVRIVIGGEFRVGYFAGKDQTLVPFGKRLTYCPECGNEFPRLRWDDFLEEHCADGFGP
jgi:hypothetical protein